MKKILCYGDSNTFGYNPSDSLRFDENTRWTGVLRCLLKEKYEIIEEGANNRTAFKVNPKGSMFSAQTHFLKIIPKLKDVEILIFSLGTNDLQAQYDIDFETIETELEKLILESEKYFKNIILVPPVKIKEESVSKFFRSLFDENSILKSQTVGEIYKKLAQKYGCALFDFNDFVSPSDLDGLHYDSNSHKIIAEKLYKFIINNY